MKTVKKLAAFLLCAALVVTCFAGCHKSGAVVASLKDGKKEYTVSSGIYLAMLINADSEARSLVYDELSEAGKSTEDIKYAKQTVKGDDGKEYKFYDYVNMRAKQMTEEYLTTNALFDKYKLKLDDEDKSSISNYALYQWSYNGSSYVFEENGVSYESYEEYVRVNMFMRSEIFDYLYGEKGEKAPSKSEIEAALKENFAVAYELKLETTDENGAALEEDELNAVADKLQAYCDDYNSGKTTFADIKAKEEPAEEETEEESTEEAKPKDELETVFGGSDTSVASSVFEDISKCEVGKATVLKSADGYYRMVVLKDIMADPYYYDTYRDETVRIKYADTFNDDIKKEAKKLKVEYNNYELNYIKPKKISYDAYDEWYAGAMNGMVG